MWKGATQNSEAKAHALARASSHPMLSHLRAVAPEHAESLHRRLASNRPFADWLESRHAAGERPRDAAHVGQLLRLAEDTAWVPPLGERLLVPSRGVDEVLRRHALYAPRYTVVEPGLSYMPLSHPASRRYVATLRPTLTKRGQWVWASGPEHRAYGRPGDEWLFRPEKRVEGTELSVGHRALAGIDDPRGWHPFLAGMLQHPQDQMAPLVFADYLEEQGDPAGQKIRNWARNEGRSPRLYEVLSILGGHYPLPLPRPDYGA